MWIKWYVVLSFPRGTSHHGKHIPDILLSLVIILSAGITKVGKASKGSKWDISSLRAAKLLVLSRILINTLCQLFTLDRTGRPTFMSVKSSAFTFRTSSGYAPSSKKIKHEQNPLVISESLSAPNLILPYSSISTSSHTWAAQPGTRFSGARVDSPSRGRTVA
uniref:Uncharacterized protein n=1 Tax=Opuntia streptacantha TaxID=393608 RepID=A0A7C8YQT8_OPUST